MFRNATSIALALAIIATLTGSACLACWMPVQKSSGSCCTQKTSCHKPPKVPAGHAHDTCPTDKLVDPANIEKPANNTSHQLAPIAEPASLIQPPLNLNTPELSTRNAATSYPPELYILNSVLRV